MNHKNIIKTLTVLSFTFLFLASQYGCEPKDINPETKELKKTITENIQAETKQDSFTITISNGGGFTGLKNGYTLNSEGAVKRWRQLSVVKDTIIWETKTDGKEIYNFAKQLEESGILNKQYDGSGNITFVLSYTKPDTSYRWSWNGRNSEQNIPSEIKTWFKQITDFIISVKKKR